MMETPFDKILDALKVFDPKKIAINHLKEIKEELEDMVSKQLLDGETPIGEPIRPEYQSLDYAKLKQRLFPNPKRDLRTPNLKLNGDYHKGITAQTNEEETVFTNTDLKDRFLQPKYGDLMNLNEKNKEDLIQDIELVLIEERNKLFL